MAKRSIESYILCDDQRGKCMVTIFVFLYMNLFFLLVTVIKTKPSSTREIYWPAKGHHDQKGSATATNSHHQKKKPPNNLTYDYKHRRTY